jgi:hypothetical protein
MENTAVSGVTRQLCYCLFRPPVAVLNDFIAKDSSLQPEADLKKKKTLHQMRARLRNRFSTTRRS